MRGNGEKQEMKIVCQREQQKKKKEGRRGYQQTGTGVHCMAWHYTTQLTPWRRRKRWMTTKADIYLPDSGDPKGRSDVVSSFIFSRSFVLPLFLFWCAEGWDHKDSSARACPHRVCSLLYSVSGSWRSDEIVGKDALAIQKGTRPVGRPPLDHGLGMQPSLLLSDKKSSHQKRTPADDTTSNQYKKSITRPLFSFHNPQSRYILLLSFFLSFFLFSFRFLS